MGARKRLQTARKMLNNTHQNIHLRPNSSLFNGFESAQPQSQTSSFSASLYNAAAGRSIVSPDIINLTSFSSTFPGDASASIAAPLDLSSSQSQAEVINCKGSTKRMKLEQHLSASSSPGPDSGIGEMGTILGSRELTSGTSSSDSESPMRRSVEESHTSMLSADKWPSTCNHQADMDELRSWSVEQVCEFVGNIDICAEYVQVNRLLYLKLSYEK